MHCSAFSKRLDFGFNNGDGDFTRVPGVDPAITTDHEADGQAENPSVMCAKTGIADSDGVFHFELLVKGADRFGIIVK